METMLAAVYHGPQDIRVESVPVPDIGPDEVLLRVLRANICGTDLRILHGGHRMYPPGTVRIPGHEVVGEVAAVGERVSGYWPGAHGRPSGSDRRFFAAPDALFAHWPWNGLQAAQCPGSSPPLWR